MYGADDAEQAARGGRLVIYVQSMFTLKLFSRGGLFDDLVNTPARSGFITFRH